MTVTEGPLAFEPTGSAKSANRWIVSCGGVECALLQICRIDSQWDLNGIGALDDCSVSWKHSGAHFLNPPAWVRRETLGALAAWALDALDALAAGEAA